MIHFNLLEFSLISKHFLMTSFWDSGLVIFLLTSDNMKYRMGWRAWFSARQICESWPWMNSSWGAGAWVASPSALLTWRPAMGTMQATVVVEITAIIVCMRTSCRLLTTSAFRSLRIFKMWIVSRGTMVMENRYTTNAISMTSD